MDHQISIFTIISVCRAVETSDGPLFNFPFWVPAGGGAVALVAGGAAALEEKFLKIITPVDSKF